MSGTTSSLTQRKNSSKQVPSSSNTSIAPPSPRSEHELLGSIQQNTKTTSRTHCLHKPLKEQYMSNKQKHQCTTTPATPKNKCLTKHSTKVLTQNHTCTINKSI
eukprot:10017406-Ditylum_brightwellii.AAC.1